MTLRLLHITSLVSVILLIIGFNIIPAGLFEGQPGVELPSTIKVANVLFCIITAILIVLVFIALVAPVDTLGTTAKPASQSRQILMFIAAALPFMSIRVVFVTSTMFRSSNPLHSNLVLKAILEYLTETVVVIIYCVLGATFLGRPTLQPDDENDYPISVYPTDEPSVGSSEQTQSPPYPVRMTMYSPPQGSPSEVHGALVGKDYKTY